jgi:DNA repair protein RadD
VIVPRHYQVRLIEEVKKAIRAKYRRILIVLPTGGGKTFVFVLIADGAIKKKRRAIFAAHRVELIDQTFKSFARLGVTSVGVIRAKDRRTDRSQPIQIASIQTLARRTRPPADLVGIDEAHRACASTYQEALFAAYPDALMLGLTATPCRVDGKPLGNAFDVIVHGPSYSELIAEGWIVAPMVYSTPMHPDLSKVKTMAGDYSQKDLEEAVNRRALIGNIFDEWERRSGGRRTVIFCVSVEHSKAVAAEFTSRGVAAEHLDGETSDDERPRILARLESGATRVVTNFGVLCEGWDQPSCKCIVLARPTKSLALYMQMAGRGLRPWCPCGCPAEARCPHQVLPIILDHGGCVDRHGMPHEDREWSLEGVPKRAGSAPMKACPKCFAFVASALMVCPYCAHEWPPPVAVEREAPEVLEGVELALRSLTGTDARLSYFKRLAKEAEQKRFKPGWVIHAFRDKFGIMPPTAWYRAVQKAARKDKEWAAAVDPLAASLQREAEA